MPKPMTRAYSHYARDAVILLGQMIRVARLERRMTVAELAERADVSRGLVQRIERGDMGCGIGAAFEMAAIVGVPLFDAGADDLARLRAATQRLLTLLPKSARSRYLEIDDDF